MCEQTISPTGHQGKLGRQMKQVGVLTPHHPCCCGPVFPWWVGSNPWQLVQWKLRIGQLCFYIVRYFSPIIHDVTILFLVFAIFPNTVLAQKGPNISRYFSGINLDSSRFAHTQGTGKKRAYLAQPKADRGQTWPSLALSWVEQEPNLGLTCAELGPVGPKLSPAGVQHGATWARLDASWAQHAQLGPVWSYVGGVQVRFKGAGNVSRAEPIWSSTWTSCSQRKRVRLRAKLRGADVAAMLDQNGAFGRWWATLQNVQITTVPPLKLYQTDRSARSSHRFLNYHASAPSARADFCWSKSN